MDDKNKHLSWSEITRKIAGNFRIFNVHWVKRKDNSGNIGEFVLVDAPDWVTVVPLLKDEQNRDCFLMVKQFRHGSNSITIEFPAGAINRGEDPKIAGIRELREETGYKAQKLDAIGKVNPNPAFMTNENYFFVATDLQFEGAQILDRHELVDYSLIPVTEVANDLGKEPYNNGIMLIAYQLYEKWKKSQI